MQTNVLYYDDNLDILRRYLPMPLSTWSTSTRRLPPMPSGWAFDSLSTITHVRLRLHLKDRYRLRTRRFAR
jgi:hypothetical protein